MPKSLGASGNSAAAAAASNEAADVPGGESFRQEFLEQLSQIVDPDKIDVWFDQQVDLRRVADGLQVLTANEFALRHIQNKFDSSIRQVAHGKMRLAHVEYQVCEQLHFQPPVSKTPKRRPRRDLSELRHTDSESSDRDKKSNDNPGLSFVFCSQNQIAATALKEMIQFPGQISPILFHGTTGCGKTQLLKTIDSQYRAHTRSRRVVRISAEQFTTRYLAGLNGDGLPMFRSFYRDLDLLILDDIQFFKGKRATTEEFQHTMDSLLSQGRQVVLSADRSPLELEFLSQELLTRINSGLVCPIRFPDREARIKITHGLARERQFEFADDVVEMIADRFPNDIRRISGALNRLRMVSNGPQATTLDAQRAEQELSDLIQVEPLRWSLPQIETAVCRVAGVSKEEIRSSSRRQKVCTARMLAMWLSRQYTRSALTEIGSYFGGRSHSTVISATRKVEKLIDSGEAIALNQHQLTVRSVLERIQRDLGETG